MNSKTKGRKRNKGPNQPRTAPPVTRPATKGNMSSSAKAISTQQSAATTRLEEINLKATEQSLLVTVEMIHLREHLNIRY